MTVGNHKRRHSQNPANRPAKPPKQAAEFPPRSPRRLGGFGVKFFSSVAVKQFLPRYRGDPPIAIGGHYRPAATGDAGCCIGSAACCPANPPKQAAEFPPRSPCRLGGLGVKIFSSVAPSR
jgi:hypothetical protein